MILAMAWFLKATEGKIPLSNDCLSQPANTKERYHGDIDTLPQQVKLGC
jgi:hypothetical protein